MHIPLDYPAPIQTQLQGLTDQISRLSPTSIVLLGSTARDELVYRQHENGQLELFSDFEMLVVWDSPVSNANRQALKQIAHKFEQKIANPNPLFHIDLLPRRYKRLAKLPPLIFTHEMKVNGRVLFGRDVLPAVPTVTLDNLNLRNTNEILFKRLWAIMLHLPKNFVLGGIGSAETNVTTYILCRNALDISTVLLPHKGVLLPSYRQRVAHLQQHPDLLGADLTDFLANCLTHRQSLNVHAADLPQLYQQTIKHLEAAITTLLPQPLPNGSRHIFNEWPISRGEILGYTRNSMHHLRSGGLRRTTTWLRAARKGLLTQGLLLAHHALITHFSQNPDQANRLLHESIAILAQLSTQKPRNPTTSQPFPRHWLTLRQLWGNIWRDLIRLGDTNYDARFQHVMSWEATE